MDDSTVAATNVPDDLSVLGAKTSGGTIIGQAVDGSFGDFGPYELLDEIGRGGMWIVYRAHHKRLDRPVALKMILSGSVVGDDEMGQFLTEAQAAAKVKHPNVVGVYEAGEVHGCPFIAMELVEGMDLAQKIATGVSSAEVARLMLPVARAVEHLHERGIIHRDLKPSNILLDEKGAPYVGDFGLAKMQGRRSQITQAGRAIGTPNYMSPEQAIGDPEDITAASDVYSLGAVLYHLLCGRPPFVADTLTQIVIDVVKSQPVSLRSHRADIPRDLENICLKCLEKDPDRRYASAGELGDDLQRYLQGQAVEATPLTLGRRLARWTVRESALAGRLIPMAVMYVIELVWFHVLGITTRSFHFSVMIVVPVWALVSWYCHRVIRRRTHPKLGQWVWVTVDALCLTSILLATPTLTAHPLLVIFPLLIADTALWHRTRIVWFATGLAIGAYALLWATAVARNSLGLQPFHVHLVYMTSLGLLGFVVSRLARRLAFFRRCMEV